MACGFIAGAEHHGVDPAYRAWLANLEGYERSSQLGLVAATTGFLAAGTLAAPLAFATAAASALGGGSASSVLQEGVVRTLHEATRAAWWLHDTALTPLLGQSGCRNDRRSGRASTQPN